MLKSWVVIETPLASRSSAAIAAKISHSLPKPHEPMRLPSKSATRLDAVAGPRDLQGARLLEDLRDVGQLDAGGLEGAEHLRHPGDREVDVAGDEGILRHDVAAGGDDLDVVEALLLEVALVERDVVAGELRLRQPLQLQLDRGERLEVAASPPALASGDGSRARRERERP